MASIHNLNQTLHTWTRRLRLQRAALWALRGFVAALVFTLLIGGVGLFQEKIIKSEFLFLMISALAIFPLLFGLIAYLWRILPLEAARHFDREFGLDERISTALEFASADHANEILQKQLDDAVSSAHAINPRREIPLRFKRADLILALILTFAIAALWLRSDALFTAASQQRQVETAITEQQKQVEEIIKAINENNSLSAEQKQALTKPLEQAQQDLKETKSLEGAVSVLTSTGEKMQALSMEQGSNTMQALKESGSSLSSQEGTPMESVGKDLASGNFSKAATDLKNMNLSQMTPQELAKLAEQLDSMVESLASSNPQMAQQLKDAADKIRAGDLASAQESLNNAATQMGQVAQQAAASQAAGAAAAQIQSSASEMLAGGGAQDAQAQAGNNNQAGQNAGGAGSGSGSADAPDSNQAGSEAGSSPIPQNNGAGDGGESTYEQIYAPPLLGGSGTDTLGLPTTGNEGEVIGESPTTATEGKSLVPYSEVYGQYEKINGQAIDNGDVPSQFMDVVRNYFDSIQP